MHPSAQIEPAPARRFAGSSRMLGFVGLHLGFALTGAYTALIGAALPVIAAHWHLLDERSGAMFLAQFTGSMLGALARGARLLRLVAAGFALVGAACAGLAHVAAWGALAVLFLYGLGLGIAMTSTSVWMHARFVHSGSALESLNAVWAAGAGVAPWAVLPWVRPGTLDRFLLLAALPAWAFAAWLLVYARGVDALRLPHTPVRSQPSSAAAFSLAAALAVLSFGAVGVESSLGGWMTTYVARTAQAGVLSASGAASGFWFGLLGSRLAATVLLLGAVPLRRLMWISLTLAACGLSVLLVAHTSWLLLVCAVVCGVGIGPVYPMVLTVSLRLFRGRWMFVAAGLGAAALPWCTGVVSQRAGSLRAGLGLPLAVLAVMALALAAGGGWMHERDEGVETSPGSR